MTKQNKTERWVEEFEKFWLEVTNEKKWINGKPTWNGYVYVTVGNAVMAFISQLLSDARREAIKETMDEIRGRLTNRFGNYGNEERLEIFRGELNDIEDRLTALTTAEESIKNLK